MTEQTAVWARNWRQNPVPKRESPILSGMGRGKWLAPKLQSRLLITRKVQVSGIQNGSAGFFDVYVPYTDELIANNAFSGGSTDWALGCGWTVANGIATCDGTQLSDSALEQTAPITCGGFYWSFLNVVSISGGSAHFEVGGQTGTDITSAGFPQERFAIPTPGSGQVFKIVAPPGVSLSVDTTGLRKEFAVWAEVREFLPGEWAGGQQVRGVMATRITIRFRKDFESDCYFSDLGLLRRYRIREYREHNREYLIISAETTEDLP